MSGVQVRGATKQYGEKTAVKGLSLAVEPGTVAGLVGPNGCGKTTTLAMISGLVEPDGGTISVAGHDTAVSPIEARRNLGFVPDTPSGFEQLDVGEYLDLYRTIYHQPRARYEERAGVVLEAFGLLEHGGAGLGELSHGIRRKVATTATLALDVPVILIDEPTVGLDPEGVMVLRRLVRHIGGRGCAVLLATQDLTFAERACDHLYLLYDGLLVADGSPARLRERYKAGSIEETFLAATGMGRRIHDFERRLDALSR